VGSWRSTAIGDSEIAVAADGSSVFEDFEPSKSVDPKSWAVVRFSDLGRGLLPSLDFVRGLRRGPALTSGAYITRSAHSPKLEKTR